MFTVFFADDEPFVTEGLRIMVDWERLGIEIVGDAADGLTAFERIRELKPDIVISDICMPGMDGTELIERCAAELERLPEFIMLSGYSELDYVKKSMRYGSKHYLLKPLEPGEITQTLEEVLGEIARKRECEEENRRLLHCVEEETFQKLFFSGEDDGLVERARFLLDIPSAEDRISMVMFRLSPRMNSADTFAFVNRLRNSEAVGNALALYTGMMVVSVICAARSEAALSKVAELGKNCCDNICVCTVGGLRQLRSAYRYIIANFRAASGEVTFVRGADKTVYDFKFDADADKAVTMLLKQDRAGAIAEVRGTFKEIREKNISQDLARGYVSSLLLSMHRYSGDMGMNIEEIYNEAIKQFSGSLDYRRAEYIAVDLLNSFAESVTNANKTDDMAVTKEILEYIDNHYAEHITLNDISGAVYLQPGIISKRIKAATGMKFSDYLAYVRIKHAQRLMSGTNRKISQIAADVGYSYYYYFVERFKSITGCNPSDYRRTRAV